MNLERLVARIECKDYDRDLLFVEEYGGGQFRELKLSSHLQTEPFHEGDLVDLWIRMVDETGTNNLSTNSRALVVASFKLDPIEYQVLGQAIQIQHQHMKRHSFNRVLR